MARPKKQTVDYFPHQCVPGKTIFILEQKFQNDGYAFWFKLLERLGCTEGHFLDLNNGIELLYISAKARLDEDKCIEILDCLSDINAIDSELWRKEKKVWCQKFVNGLLDLYGRRKVETPTKERALQNSTLITSLSDEEKQKIWCRNATNRAVASGRLIRYPCQVCLTTVDIEAHHDDYNNPFEVTWLCKIHHINLHNGINVDIKPIKPDNGLRNTNINPQIKVDQSKGEESKEDQIKVNNSSGGSMNGHEKTFLVGEMHKVWVKSFPTYTANQELDYPALKNISDFIFQTANVKNGYGNAEEEIKILNTLQLIADEISKDTFWVNKSLNSISKHIQEFYNKIKNPTSNGNSTKSGTSGTKLSDDILKQKLAAKRPTG